MAYRLHEELPESLKYIHGQFKKSELISIMEELDVEDGHPNTRAMVISIVNSLDEDGIPDADDSSEELFEFLLNAHYIDEDGKLLQGEDVVEDEESEHENDGIMAEVEDDPLAGVEVPECYTYADSRDPACGKCKLYDLCMAERLVSRPSCFGKLFDVNSEECRACLEFGDCKDSM